MGRADQQMTRAALVNALLYKLAKWLIERKPALALHPLIRRLLAWCKPDWEQWKVNQTMQDVDRQSIVLVDQWATEEKEKQSEILAEKAKQLFPEATITALPNAIVPSVMIIHEADDSASNGVKALGGELRITNNLDL
jgi:hypothetical protein